MEQNIRLEGVTLQNQVPDLVVAEDAYLETQAETAQEGLYHHRWQWTINPDNPNRVSYAEYGLAVARSATTIRMQALGYAGWLKNKEMTLREHTERANMSQEKAMAVDALAAIYNSTFGAVRVSRTQEAMELRNQAKLKAEAKSITYEEALAEVAEFHRKTLEANNKDRARFRKDHGMRFVAVENEIGKARHALTKAMRESHTAEWTEQEVTLLQDSVKKLKSLLQLIEVSVAGSTEIDWDDELRKLGVA